ncbi:PTS system beta-glucoside-specific EIIBCA component [compost metagenome]
MQLLIHIGINTVSLKGSGFTAHVTAGDKVKAGQLLLEFDRDAITAAGYPLISPIIVPDGQEVIERVEELTGGDETHPGAVLKIYLQG